MKRSPYLVSPTYDWVFFLSPPLVALALGIAISNTRFTNTVLAIGEGDSAAGILIGILIHAHLFAVVLRSHGNPDVRRRHPVRFMLVPAALWCALMWSTWLAIAATVVATFWDVWHSGAQTFGFARIYDRNAGIAPDRDRALDLWVNQALYAGPILAGATLGDHLGELTAFGEFHDPVSAFLTEVPARAEGSAGALAWVVIAVGTSVVGIYVGALVRRAMRGEPISRPKLFLVTSTGLTSIYTWGFNSWGEAFFIMNLFHAVQYLALVWWSERSRLEARLHWVRRGLVRPVGLALFLGGTLTYGAIASLGDADIRALWSFTLVVSLMHFWYDSFVWSVRRSEV